MKTTIDKGGRLVIPKAVRIAAGLEPGTEVELRVVDGRVELVPAPLDVRFERRGRFLVAVPRESVPTVTAAEIERTIQDLREGRLDEERG
jgi:AbrB family looped-hinge helix DNA binding protein